MLHIHFIGFDSVEDVHWVLRRCVQEKKRIIYTSHNVTRMYDEDEASYLRKTQVICSFAHRVITLTQSSADSLLQRVQLEGLKDRMTVIPLGWSVNPHHPRWGAAGSSKDTVEYVLYGTFRHNREFYTLLLNWYYGLLQYNTRLNIFALPINPCDIETKRPHVAETMSFIQSDPQRMRLHIFPSLTDDQVIDLVSNCDILLMPYVWGSHSAQLEQAFDLNLLPVISNVGFYYDQWQVVQDYVPEPIWFDWSDGNVFHYGSRLTEALLAAQHRIMHNQRPAAGEEFRQHRLREHERLLDGHLKVYHGD
ncbi:MAG: hypothetical protein M3120_05360 [Pseudomonadota bacterium]|nr:hypothetical protein [Pseudomonadota bacterium]